MAVGGIRGGGEVGEIVITEGWEVNKALPEGISNKVKE